MNSNFNKGMCSGILASAPKKAAEGVTLITIRNIDDRINPKTRRRNVFYLPFVLFGREAEKALKYLVKGQEVYVEYKLESSTKEKDGVKEYYNDNVVTSIKYGKKPELPKAVAEEEPKEDN